MKMEQETHVTAAKKTRGAVKATLVGIVTTVLAVVSLFVSFKMLSTLFFAGGGSGAAQQSGASDVAIMDRFDMFVTNTISDALDGVVAIEKVYWLSDSDLVAPKPNPACFGEADSPEEIMWLLDEAKHLLDGQEMSFNKDTKVWKGQKIRYYFDETILVITWKEVIGNGVFTFSEVKIADASQFRRFLAGGEFGSDKQYTTTQMADSVNAVVASSGDFYKFRKYGIMVYNGEVVRMDGKTLDTCMIDDKGDLHFVYRKEILDKDEAQKYVDENNIRFSLAFGPVLVEDGVQCVPSGYILGEINDIYSRSALSQLGELHYLFTTMNGEAPYKNRLSLKKFADVLVEKGADKAYALDGGQTAVIAMQGKTINRVDFGYQRQISDIIYFATALPDGG